MTDTQPTLDYSKHDRLSLPSILFYKYGKTVATVKKVGTGGGNFLKKKGVNGTRISQKNLQRLELQTIYQKFQKFKGQHRKEN